MTVKELKDAIADCPDDAQCLIGIGSELLEEVTIEFYRKLNLFSSKYGGSTYYTKIGAECSDIKSEAEFIEFY